MERQRSLIQQSVDSHAEESPALNTAGTSSKKPAKRSRRNVVYGVIVLVILVPLVFFVIAQVTQPDFRPTSVSPDELMTVTHIPTAVFARIGTGGLSDPLIPTKRNNLFPSIAVGPTGKPLFFSSSAEFCPFCAGERWAMVIALSQFGSFQQIDRILSSEDSIATFTFQHVEYSSAYLDMKTLEKPQNSSPPAATPDSQEQRILSTYNAAPYVTSDFQGKVPFLDIGNRYLIAGAAFDVHILIDHSWQEIANQISDVQSSLTQSIIGTANYMIAAICMITHNQPSAICQRAEIVHIQQSLG